MNASRRRCPLRVNMNRQDWAIVAILFALALILTYPTALIPDRVTTDPVGGEDPNHYSTQRLAPSPATVVRFMIRGSSAGQERPRCSTQRLSHTTMSPTDQR